MFNHKTFKLYRNREVVRFTVSSFSAAITHPNGDKEVMEKEEGRVVYKKYLGMGFGTDMFHGVERENFVLPRASMQFNVPSSHKGWR